MGPASRALQLLGLTAWAIAQPLLDLLGQHAEFFVARHAGGADILATLLALLLLPPTALWLAELVVGFLSTTWQRALHVVWVGGLLSVLVLHGLVRTTTLPAWEAIALAIGLAGFGSWLFLRHRMVQQLVSTMAIGSGVFALFFLGEPGVRSLVFTTPETLADAGPIESTTPAVLVIFDELALSSLLNAAGDIDPIRYPAFAALAEHSTLFRRTSSIAANTNVVVPAILTGRYPGPLRRLPTAKVYPQNLFTLVQGSSYAVNAVETHTHLHVPTSRTGSLRVFGARELTLDLAIVHLHTVLPEALRDHLPDISQTWGNFADDFVPYQVRYRQKSRIFREFIAAVPKVASRAGDNRGSLHFIHSNLPHTPWRHVRSGRLYGPSKTYGKKNDHWSHEPWWTIDAYRRHLLQLEHVDLLLGLLLEQLKRSDLYDRSLIVVVADHGLSFWPDVHRRNPAQHAHPEDILHVPLILKRPGQRHAEVSDRVAETIDIVPTIADILNLEIPWRVDGCSLLRDDCPVRSTRSMFVEDKGSHRLTRLRYPADVLDRRDTLERKLRLFGSEPLGLYRPLPYSEYAGRAVAEFPLRAEPSGWVQLASRHPADSVATNTRFVPIRILGDLEFDAAASTQADSPPLIAVAIGGTIEAVVPAPPLDAGGDGWISALVREEAVRDGLGDLELFLLETGEAGPSLSRLLIRE